MAYPFLEITIDGKRVRELLPDDPRTNTDSAYQLLELFRVISGFCSYNGLRPAPYRLIEEYLKKQYWECMTGIPPSEQTKEDITAEVSLLEVLVFFRQIGQEARYLTEAINSVWKSLPYVVTLGEYRKDEYREEAA